MRAYRLAAIAGVLGCACSLITHLDPPNDGGAADTGGDAAALCTPVVIGDVGASALVTSLVADPVSGRAYFSGTASGGVYSVALDAGADGSVSTLATFTQPRRLATAQVKVDPQSYVYVTTFGGGSANGGVYAIAPDGGTSALVDGSVTLDGSTTQVHAFGIATTGTVPATLYWASGTQVFTTSPSNVTSVVATIDASVHDVLLTLTGTTTPWWDTQTTQTMFTFAPDGGLASFACAGVMLYAQSTGSTPARVYYTTDAKCLNNQPPQINWVSTSDFTSTGTLATTNTVDSPTALAFDGTYLYWANQMSQTIYRVDPTTSGPPTLVATSPSAPHQLAVTGNVVYWTIDSGVVRCAL